MNAHQYVQTLDLTLNTGHRGNCPVCGGKNTFTATATVDGIKYNCYKAGCKTSGIDTSNLTAEQLRMAMALRKQEQEMQEPTPMLIPQGFTKQIPSDVSLPYLDVVTHDLYYDVKRERLCIPIKWKGCYVDFVGRSTNGTAPKWLRYSNAHVPYMYGTGDTCVLVEDVLSAIAAGEVAGCVGVALLGTNVIAEYVPIILEYKRIIVALDPDARSKTLAIAKELKSMHDKVYAFNLRDDLKYRDSTDIANLITMTER